MRDPNMASQSGRRRYKNPPIVEALCEFRFAPAQKWDFAIPGRLQAALGSKYVGASREQKAVEVGIRVQEGELASLGIEESLQRVLLVSTDGIRLVGVGPSLLSIHMLRPYHGDTADSPGGWEEFQERISEALNAYWAVAQPTGVVRVGIRYVNRITVASIGAEIGYYFKCAPAGVEGLPRTHITRYCQTSYRYDDGVDLVLSHGSPRSDRPESEYLLDLDVIREAESPVTMETALTWAKDLRNRERGAFEAIITDMARELFDE